MSVPDAFPLDASGERRTQCDRLLERLSDRRWYFSSELDRIVPRLTSRISDLRKLDYTIVCERVGKRWRYRLVAGPDDQVSDVAAALPSRAASGPACGTPAARGPASSADDQLALDGLAGGPTAYRREA